MALGIYFMVFLLVWVICSKKFYALDYDDAPGSVLLALCVAIAWPLSILVVVLFAVIIGISKVMPYVFRMK